MYYEEIVNKRKSFLVPYPGFINQSQVCYGMYDTGNYLDPWAQWYNSVPADVLVVGQDWGGTDYYIKNHGKDLANNFTCSTLIKLFSETGIDIGNPALPRSNLKLHFSNLIPFIRIGQMQGNKNNIVNDTIIKECALNFLKPLIEMTQPNVIITLGRPAYKGVCYATDTTINSQSFTELVEKSPHVTPNGITVFPMFHCGALGVNLNRKMNLQLEDWKKITPYIESIIT